MATNPPAHTINHALLVVAVVVLAVLFVADLVRFALPPDPQAWEVGGLLAFVLSFLPWWP